MTEWSGTIHPAADLFPMLTGDEMASLVASIRAKGLEHHCWVMPDGALLDGRNRVHACREAGVEPRFRTYTGDDPIGFVVRSNIERRHLTTGQRAMLALEIAPMYEADAAKRQELAGVQYGRGQGGKVVADLPQPIEPQPKSRDRAGKAANVSGRAVQQAKRVTEKAPDLAPKVKSGELPIDRADRIVRDREAAERRQKEAEAQQSHIEVGTRVDIRHGDFREVLADLSDVDAIITDPPYPAEFLPMLDDLAAWADKVLAPDGVLAVLFGQTHLPEVYRRLDGHRPYRWTMAYLTPGPSYASMARKLHSNWKPVLVYGGNVRRFADVVRAEGGDIGAKSLHHWGQDYGAFHQLVERLSEPGATVVDPFMGSGTTLAAAKALGRHAIGCDIDPEHVAVARRRLA